MTKLRIGILFGGIAREREISFAGGKTALENIDQTLFVPIPIFVDSLGNFILIKSEFIYSKSIRDFYPPKAYQSERYQIYVESLGVLSESEADQLASQIGRKIQPADLTKFIDFAFIAMHGPGAEDGSIQGLLEWYNIPYSGPGILGSGVGIDKIAQNDMLKLAVGLDKKTAVLQKDDWNTVDHSTLFEKAKSQVGLPFVVKAPHQGSSIGVAFVKKDDLADFETAVNQCLFIRKIKGTEWLSYTDAQKQDWIQNLTNLDTGLGFPVVLNNQIYYHPEKLETALDSYLNAGNEAIMTSTSVEDAVLLEGFVNGQEFSCGVIQKPNGEAVALPPTEIVKMVEVFDFKTKYTAGASRKRMPPQAPLASNQRIQHDVKLAFEKLGFNVCTRIDGFLKEDGSVVLHDPNTIPGMSPTSLIFKQMAEIGLNVTDAITYFIRQSMRERIRTGKANYTMIALLNSLDEQIANKINLKSSLPNLAIIFGGADEDSLHENYAKARGAYGKNYAAGTHNVVGYLKQNDIYLKLPIQLMFKDYAEDLTNAIAAGLHPLIAETRANAKEITQHYVGEVDFGWYEVNEITAVERLEFL